MSTLRLLFFIWLLLMVVDETLAISPSEKRMQAWSTIITEFLAQDTSNKYSALEQFEKEYQNLNPIFSTLNLNDITLKKANKLHDFLKEKEAIIERVVSVAEKERQKYNKLEVTEEDVWFFKSKLPSNNEGEIHNTSSGTSNPHRSIHYHNSKCKCGYQILGVTPNEIDKTVNCFEPVNGFRASPHFNNGAVSFEESSVHIPTEVYNGGKEILKDIYLSDRLFDTFYHELCNESSSSAIATKWLYFTTKNGAMRFFPGKPRIAEDCMMPDLYDSRITPWYLQSVSSPKDVVILLDNSGSIEGLTLNLIKRSVKHVLDTLTPNDFVNIILFNENITYVLSKCQNLVQATPVNKQYLLKALDNFRIANKSNFELGFATALQGVDDSHLKTIDLPHAGCNSVVLLFTDGGAVYPEEAVDKWNWDKNHPKRVFSYAVGKNFYEIQSVSHIACRNRGVFHRIPSFGATKEATQKYLLKLGKPMVIHDKKLSQWTLPYPDSLGLGAMISASLPVYSTDEEGEPEFIGVVGADVLIADIQRAIDDDETGRDMYTLAVDNNGFAFLHPDLKSKPYYSISTVDITELESENFAQIRDEMIDRITKEAKVHRRVFYNGNKYTHTTKFMYSYMPVPDTAYSFSTAAHHSKAKIIDALATLVQAKKQLLLPQDVDSTIEKFSSFLYSDPCPIAPLNSSYVCKYSSDVNLPVDTFSPASDISSYNKKCDSKVYNNLLLHGWISKQVTDNSWLSLATNASDNSIAGMFYATESPSFLKIFYNDDEEAHKTVADVLSDPANNALYRRAIHAGSDFGWMFMSVPSVQPPQEIIYQFTTEAPPNTTTDSFENTTSQETTTGNPTTTAAPPTVPDEYVIVARSVRPFSEHPNISPAVVGVVLNASVYQEQIFHKLTHDCGKESLCTAEMRIDCSNVDETICMLVDDGGFLVFSNQPQHATVSNKFIGYIDGGVTRSLISNGILNVAKHRNSQTMCTSTEEDDEPSSALRSFLIPSIVQLLSFGWWMSTSAMFFISTVIQTLWMVMATVLSGTQGHLNKEIKTTTLVGPPNEAPLDYCLFETNVLEFTHKQFHYDDTVACNDACNRTYSAMRITETNLLLIVADFGEGCVDSCLVSPPFENTSNNIARQQICQNTNNITKYRKPYGQCYDSRDITEEADEYCGAASTHLSRLIMFLCLIISMFLYLH